MILKLSAIAIIATFAFVLLKKERADFAFVIEFVSTAAVLIFIFPFIEEIIALFADFEGGADIGIAYEKILIKCTGITLLSRLVCELCKDAGEQALASKFALAGNVLVLINALPVFRSLYELLQVFVENLL